MDIWWWWWWKELPLLFVFVVALSNAQSDLFEAFRPKADNPPELNRFLTSVLQHEDDFSFVRNVAKKFQKVKKDTELVMPDHEPDPLLTPQLDLYQDLPRFTKRHVHNYHNVNKRFRSFGPMKPKSIHKKLHRFRRYIDKRHPDEVAMDVEFDGGYEENPGEKADGKRDRVEIIGDGRNLVNSAVHKTMKSIKGHHQDNVKNNRQDFYYVDLEDGAEKAKERDTEKKRYEWPSMSGENPNFFVNDGPVLQQPSFEYERPIHHNGPSDLIPFEQAQSFEMDVKRDNFNNPAGNSLYSVDEGGADGVEPLYLQEPEQKIYENQQPPMRMDDEVVESYPKQVPQQHHNTGLVMNKIAEQNSRLVNGEVEGTEKTATEKYQSVGEGFIEISKTKRDDSSSLNEEGIKARRDDDEGLKETGSLAKHSLHPLRLRSVDDVEEEEEEQNDDDERFQSRRLQFVDEEMIGNQESNANEEYETWPRERRDFLGSIGMRNEEDYSEDNPYRDELCVNNTDVKNDTFLHVTPKLLLNETVNVTTTTTYPSTNGTTATTKCPHTTKHQCSKSTTHHCTQSTHMCGDFGGNSMESTTVSQQKQDMDNIKQILHEPKPMLVVDIVKKKEEKRSKKSDKRSKKPRFAKTDDFLNIVDGSEDNAIVMRKSRGLANNKIDRKIMENKNKIFNNYRAAKRSSKKSSRLKPRQMPKWTDDGMVDSNHGKPLFRFHHIMDRNDESRVPEGQVTTGGPDSATEDNCDNSTSYEAQAQKIDAENEKLAEVINGRLAEKIVETVFDKLNEKTELKAKLYSGLSRTHVSFTGNQELDVFKSNQSQGQDVNDAKLLLNQMTKVLNRLVMNQVRRRLCQRLSDELKDYLDGMLNVKNKMTANNFVPNTRQGDFLFKYQESQQPPFDVKKLQQTLVTLEGLLLTYHNMNQDCQSRASPVKKYIDSHVKMLRELVACPKNNGHCTMNEAKRDTPHYHDDSSVEKELESVGLGKSHEFVPNFDLNKLIKSKIKDKREAAKSYKSEKYRKLQDAVERLRTKRENERRIGELFGGKMKRSAEKFDVDYEEPVVYSIG